MSTLLKVLGYIFAYMTIVGGGKTIASEGLHDYTVIAVAIFGGIDKINFNNLDIAVMILSVLLLFIFSANDRKITKKEGFLFLLFFVVYYGIVIFSG